MKYEETVERILKGLKEFEGFYSKDYYLDFESKAHSLRERIEESLKEGRLLKIGIVGEMKAGKSSFLNSLIFDGEDILPKASTPMTAALTKIYYAEQNKAKIVFYSSKDWESVQKYAEEYDKKMNDAYNEYVARTEEENKLWSKPVEIQTKEQFKIIYEENIPIQHKSCKELVDMAKLSSVDLEEFLGEEKIINCENFSNELDDYIGADGKYTAIVKHVELGMHNDLLEGLEIIDTPGMNDPIVSRGETTKKFLQDCDVVFLLSYAGQFLTQEDISFMTDTLPREGVENIVIVGSKLDSGVLDNSKIKDFTKAVAYSKKIYNEQASTNIEKSIRNGYNRDILMKIQESLPPLYISSLVYDVARKNQKGIPLLKYEANIIEQCRKRFDGFSEDEKFLLGFSGIGKVRAGKLKEIRSKKDSLIEEKNKKIVENSRMQLLDILGLIDIQVHDNYSKIRNSDIGKLEKQLHEIQGRLNSMRIAVKNIFEKYLVEAQGILNDMMTDIDMEVESYLEFEVHKHTEQRHHTEKTGFLGLKKEIIYTNETVYTASISDVISNMRKYIVRCKKYTNDNFKSVININRLKKDIKDVVLDVFEFTDREFRESDILIPLDIVVGKISIPQIDIEVSNYENIITDGFSGPEVFGSDVEKLKLQENKVLNIIAQQIKKELAECESKIKSLMTEQSISFVDSIITLLNENVELLKVQLSAKEESIRKYEVLIKQLSEYKEIAREMEM